MNSQAARDAARAMLDDPDLMGRIVRDVQSLGVAGEEDLIAAIYLVATSRKLTRPCSAIVQATSSTGKTITVSLTTSCIPPEDVIIATILTPNSLYYPSGPGGLKNKLLVTGERRLRKGAEQADATAALRQMLSDGRISKYLPDMSTKPPTSTLIEVEGPIACIETTTDKEIHDEDLNRCLLLGADEGPDQTRRVLLSIAKIHSGEAVDDSEAIRQRHHELQRMLQTLEVVVPFAGC